MTTYQEVEPYHGHPDDHYMLLMSLAFKSLLNSSSDPVRVNNTSQAWQTSPRSHTPSVKVCIQHSRQDLELTSPDVKEILAMIRELADYEKSENLVEATEESLTRTLTFAPSSGHTNPGYAKTLILRLPAEPSRGEQPEAVAGMALYFNNYSTWRAKPGVYLEDLYVRPQYRGRGYGKLLIQALAREVLLIDGGRLEWSCLKWNEPSLKFYRGLGAQEMNDWVGLRVDGDALVKLATAGAQ